MILLQIYNRHRARTWRNPHTSQNLRTATEGEQTSKQCSSTIGDNKQSEERNRTNETVDGNNNSKIEEDLSELIEQMGSDVIEEEEQVGDEQAEQQQEKESERERE